MTTYNELKVFLLFLWVIQGIRYAVPPTGNLRWSRPIPVWNESRYCKRYHHQHASRFGSACFQVNPYTRKYEGKEDCLFLNIWTPRLDDSANLDVMVWFHGGFLQFGSGHIEGLRPTGKLTKTLNTVFVSFNYRLDAFGFLALSELANSGPNSSFGNYGLWDQMIVLEWIRDNIRPFGGNPRRVTVFGADAGAASILAHLTNPDTAGLISGAWLIGPAIYLNRSFTTASTNNAAGFLNATKCSDAQCLRSLTPERVVQSFLGKYDPSFRINDQNDLPIRGIYPDQLIVMDSKYSEFLKKTLFLF